MVTILDNVRLYKFPYETSESITVGQNYVVQYLNNVSDFDNARWYKIKSNDKVYYILLKKNLELKLDDKEFVVKITNKPGQMLMNKGLDF